MPRPLPAVAIKLPRQQRRNLERLVRKRTAPQRLVERARIVLLAAQGKPNKAIARELRLARNTVRLWRARWAEHGLKGLDDLPRPGRPPVYDASTRAVVKAIACSLPHERKLPLSRLSIADVHAEAQKALKPCPSPTTIYEWLDEDAIRPWAHRVWVTPRDPRFYQKAAPVLDLYRRRWKGKPLEEGDVVICGDEKPCIQSLQRVVPSTAPEPGQPQRVEHEYVRKGVLVYQAFLFPATGKARGHCVARNTSEDFRALVDRVMMEEPCKSAKRVFMILDNGGAHHPNTFPEWLAEHHPKVTAVYVPVHASWLNLAEVYFSILSKKALTPMDVKDRKALAARILAFEKRYNRTAHAWRWNFTRHDLRRLLKRLKAVPSSGSKATRARGRGSRKGPSRPRGAVASPRAAAPVA